MSADLDRLPPSLRRRVAAELQPGETVRWAGSPGIVRAVLPTLFLFGFGLAWSSLTFTWEAIAVASLFASAGDRQAVPPGLSVVLAIFGLPFVAIGVALLASPAYAGLRAMLTAHAVTDRRLLTVVGGPWPSTESRAPASLTYLHRSEGASGRGTLRLGFGTETDSDGSTTRIEARWPGVPAVRDAEAAVRDLARSVGRQI
ncbi:hypothetical protein [Alsobacter sp. R-9]